ncbi:MAG TPA: hypothetical protein VI894_02465 [Candidatus Nanoarchaeia archaeon]|nr:hypothetical protein [Candidatus Nanoarchaeia archaeon]
MLENKILKTKRAQGEGGSTWNTLLIIILLILFLLVVIVFDKGWHKSMIAVVERFFSG